MGLLILYSPSFSLEFSLIAIFTGKAANGGVKADEILPKHVHAVMQWKFHSSPVKCNK